MIGITEIAEAVRRSPLPVSLIDLEGLRFVVSSPRAAETLGIAQEESRDVLSLVAEPEMAREALALLRRDRLRPYGLRSYEARVPVLRGDGSLVEFAVWTRAVEVDGPNLYALVLLVDGAGGLLDELSDVDAVIGTIDANGAISKISADVLKLLGYAIAASVGHALVDYVHPDDVLTVLRALATASSHRTHVGVEIRMHATDGSWQRFALSIRPLEHDHDLFGFVALPSDEEAPSATGAGERVAELERHLTRIAREVEAAGVIARSASVLDPDRVVGLPEMTARQWQVLTRLLRGERVATIAKAMFLSPSTVRNYLSDLYRTFGVHSQAELIERFREGGEGSPG